MRRKTGSLKICEHQTPHSKETPQRLKNTNKGITKYFETNKSENTTYTKTHEI